ncbi:hypothetical protein BU23DRAFT_560540 [Bimuria novae-zelandiae CBS 107.79]|uniref:DNA polymerase delta subunit 3 n=1 Tax=Bimuria novae-zelandiae CBS 107.79 TaxID=1447943 RepID=A0A6A5ULH1_9PLEO|nr:hypothetical protein BU23DRAFT_560540 [Bimuria novae-zelandiae CBS 107.79]
MAEESYKEYLANRVLTESQPITYRLLSRALKVNVNVAKRMLYEFYTTQTAKKPKSIHATYLIAGKKRSSEDSNGSNGHDGDDTVMRSSPFMSSLPAPEEPLEKPVPKTSIVLVREEELEKTKGRFEEITSIHVYSLEPGPLENLNLLAVCNQEIVDNYSSGDPLDRWGIYGSIRNPYVKRRTTKHTPVTAKNAPKATGKPTAPAKEAKKEAPAAAAQKESTPDENKSGRSTPQPGPAASLKRTDSKSKAKKDTAAGDLFKSFAKTKPKAKEAEKPKEEDEPMQGMSEDEGDDDDEPAVKFDEEKAAAAKKAREDREKQLREMMEADVDMPDAPTEEEKDSQDAPIDKEAPSKPAESEATVTVQGGRRRGRRRVMKKKKVKDEDGYLVTKEEAVWESFSEDEPEPKKPKPAPKPAAAKGKKAGAKGQGNIASFFKKG